MADAGPLSGAGGDRAHQKTSGLSMQTKLTSASISLTFLSQEIKKKVLFHGCGKWGHTHKTPNPQLDECGVQASMKLASHVKFDIIEKSGILHFKIQPEIYVSQALESDSFWAEVM